MSGMATSKATKEGGFTAEERAAMKERAAELKADKGGKKKADELQSLLDKIAEMPAEDRVIAERLHALMSKIAPDLAAKTWYGMPAYARDGKPLVFLQNAAKFGTRYCTLGFQDNAALDDGDMWPTSFAVTTWNDAVEKKVTALVRKAVG
ncbi:conserved hypothetical protein [Nostocoides australiense Ben110]|uniref:Uncharacterized protein n=2 Tax=Nostocoides australiense TaxID=99480 RepID=W6JYI0_9MICO|nr:conserved hypothetical protein [Tetrasphaera australiensis Ben110]